MMEDEKINQPMTELAGEAAKAERAGAVSYTHLTLPTTVIV